MCPWQQRQQLAPLPADRMPKRARQDGCDDDSSYEDRGDADDGSDEDEEYERYVNSRGGAVLPPRRIPTIRQIMVSVWVAQCSA